MPRGRYRSRSAWSSLDRGPGPSPIGDILRVAAQSRVRQEGGYKQMATAVKRREMFIGGQWVAGSGSEGQAVINPATGETIADVPKGTEADVDRAVKAARTAYVEWFETVPKERSEMLLKLAEAVAADGEELANIESATVGKPRALFLSDGLPPCVDHLRFFAGAARLLGGKAAGEYMRGDTSVVRRGPRDQVRPRTAASNALL